MLRRASSLLGRKIVKTRAGKFICLLSRFFLGQMDTLETVSGALLSSIIVTISSYVDLYTTSLINIWTFNEQIITLPTAEPQMRCLSSANPQGLGENMQEVKDSQQSQGFQDRSGKAHNFLKIRWSWLSCQISSCFMERPIFLRFMQKSGSLRPPAPAGHE